MASLVGVESTVGAERAADAPVRETGFVVLRPMVQLKMAAWVGPRGRVEVARRRRVRLTPGLAFAAAAATVLAGVVLFVPHGTDRDPAVPPPAPSSSASHGAAPAGCGEARRALDAYRAASASASASASAGTGSAGQAASARAANIALQSASSEAAPYVRTVILRLADEFRELSLRLDGTASGDPGQAVADIEADTTLLEYRCAESLFGSP
ncbi:hypothetical protein ACFYS8_18370 [Kitasatospora sp. NPDC004615]|uniref:hypothetical protein n=1 Tax=Kitasatospora sp. NPDC004615 TaxID=3364017 RepID=UPI00368C9835